MIMLAGSEQKVTRPFHEGRWDSSQTGASLPTNDQCHGMALAAQLYDLGLTREERGRLAALIAAQPQMKQPATRQLVTALRR